MSQSLTFDPSELTVLVRLVLKRRKHLETSRLRKNERPSDRAMEVAAYVHLEDKLVNAWEAERRFNDRYDRDKRMV